ncbi:MAG: signal peptidase I [Beijerinckiaceae bacterium]
MNLLRNRLVRTIWGGLISVPFPGLGHILARRWGFGASLLAITLVAGAALAILMDRVAPTPGPVAVAIGLMAFGIVAAILAALSAMRLLWRESPAPVGWRRSAWFAGLLAVAVTGVQSLIFDREWKSYSTPSTSMVPTLELGDYFFADTRAFAPKRGDVVVLRKPGDEGTVYVKRIVGLPGESVQMKAGRLFLNGAAVARAADGSVELRALGGEARPAPAYVETLPGASPHRIVEAEGDAGPLDDTPGYVVPAGSYFLMGDNRDNSVDSRMARESGGLGFVPAANIFGKAGAIFWSRSPARIFRPVQ